jgi:hypothetical protein
MLRPLSKAGKLNWCFGMRDRKALAAYRSAKWSSLRVKVSIQFSNSHDNQLLSRHCDQLARNDEESRCAFTPSRRQAPEVCIYLPPKEGVGNAGCPLHPQPRVRFALIKSTRVNEYTATPGIPARNGFNGFLRALPGDRALLPPSSADVFCLSPVGPTQLRKLDASVGASGPHDFAVRCNISRQLAW